MLKHGTVLLVLAFVVGGALGLSSPTPAVAAGELLGVDVIEDPLPYYDPASRRVRNSQERGGPASLSVLLARERYYRQDGHMEVILKLSLPEGMKLGDTRIDVAMKKKNGRQVSRFSIDPVPSYQFAFYPALPDRFEGEGEIEVVWQSGSGELGRNKQAFYVEDFPTKVEKTGSIRLELPNKEQIYVEKIPVTVGVPFPRGALYNTRHLRLVDEAGNEVPIQVKETARWSKFGSVKWILCDFTVDLKGKGRALSLEYGPGTVRKEREDIKIELRNGALFVDAGRVKIDGGVWFSPGSADSKLVKVLDVKALSGAFVKHEDGKFYTMLPDAEYIVEKEGPEKAILRRENWYQEAGGEEFCKFIIRYVIHRDSPIIRIFHTWIFTGDGNSDRISEMGWEFPLAESLTASGFLTGFGDDGSWEKGEYLVQWDYDHFDIFGEDLRKYAPGRSPGVASAANDGVRLYFGAKDFWQNYPSELEFRGGSLWFHNWPRHNRSAGYTFEGKLLGRGEARGPAIASAARHEHYESGVLTNSEWRLNAAQLRFAHEGELLDFRLPEVFGEDVFAEAMRENHWEPGRVESVNAQGISRTEEMWIFFESKDGCEENAKRILRGLNDESLRVVVDPVWISSSGAFGAMHHRDIDNYPEEERIYELVCHSILEFSERMGIYGMWIYGDLPAWRPELPTLEPGLYRAYRKGHQGWPFSWKSYARSGDNKLLKIAEASTRQMIDANYCHYYDDRVNELVGSNRRRGIGRWGRSPLPWAGYNGPVVYNYESKCDFLWEAYFLTGFGRARDNALCLGAQFKKGNMNVNVRLRHAITLLKSFIDMYEATFDPWFIAGAHAIAEGHMHLSQQDGFAWRRGRIWEEADCEFFRFSGRKDFKVYLMELIGETTHHRKRSTWSIHVPQFPIKSFAWELTGDDYYLRRISRGIEYGTSYVQDGDEPDYLAGYPVARGHRTAFSIFTGYYISWFPSGLWALANAEYRPEPIHTVTAAGPRKNFTVNGALATTITFRKDEGESFPLTLNGHRFAKAEDVSSYFVTGPDGEKVASGEWNPMTGYFNGAVSPGGDIVKLEIPADAPAGDYRLAVVYDGTVSRSEVRSVCIPVSDKDRPEVIELNKGEPMFNLEVGIPLWFMVPEGLERFLIEFPESDLWPSVWDPDGRRVWSNAQVETGNAYPVIVELTVKPEHAGRLWRLTQAPEGMVMDPGIPPVYSVNPSRWFMPKPAVQAEEITSAAEPGVLIFDGKESYVEASKSVPVGADNFTYEICFKPGEADEHMALMGTLRGDSIERPGINLRYHGAGRIFFRAANRKHRVRLEYYPETTAEIMNVAVTVDRSGKAKLFFNGELVDEEDASGFGDDDGFDSGSFRVGIRPITDIWHFKGEIKEVRVWKKALKQEEIRENILGELTGDEEGLLLYWPMKEGKGDIVFDKTPGENHGRIVNASWKAEN